VFYNECMIVWTRCLKIVGEESLVRVVEVGGDVNYSKRSRRNTLYKASIDLLGSAEWFANLRTTRQPELKKFTKRIFRVLEQK